ncbi:MAG: hypothetical protein QXR73_00525 [Candidatus Micrarchaeaceae archaeon]
MLPKITPLNIAATKLHRRIVFIHHPLNKFCIHIYCPNNWYGVATHKGIIAYIAIILVIIALWYFTVGFKLPTRITSTSTLSSTIKPNTSSNVTPNKTTISSTIYYLSNCANLGIFNSTSNTIITNYCSWRGGTIGIWVASGSTKSINYSIKGTNNITYLKGSSSYSCVTFLQNITLPAQIYNVTLKTGQPGGTCSNKYAFIKLNTTTTAPSNMIYPEIYNGNFSTGAYNGWSLNGTGFGTAPLSVAKADNESCYLTAPWAGYNGSYFATTFNCGLSNAPGNLTSSPFVVSEPFLNFKIISPEDANIYVEILYNGSPAEIAHYNTYNISKFGTTSPYTFRNASIPLISFSGDAVQIRVVARSLKHHNYIAVTGFQMSTLPLQTPGILINLTTT